MLIEVAYGALEHFFTDMKLVVDVLCRRLVSERAVAVVVEKILMETL